MTRLHLVLAPAFFAASTVALGACAALPPVVPDAPQASRGWPEGTPVKLGQPVSVGALVVTPVSVVEDSRCPVNARCVWAGRLIVRTQIDGAGWRDTTNITLGESYGTHGSVVTLVSGEPGKTTDRETQPGEYRFVYEAR